MDALVFINVRLLTPFTLNISALSDPIYRLSKEAYKLDKNLKQLFTMYYEPLKLDYTSYFKFLSNETRIKNLGYNKHLVMLNLSKLL